MHNILVGLDSSRSAETALRQAIAVAEGLNSRLHLLRAIEPVGPGSEAVIDQPDDPISILDRVDAMMEEDELGLPSDDDELAAALRLCEDAGVACSYQRLHGMAPHVLREQCVAMDLLVLGRRGAIARKPLGSTTTSLLLHPIVPTLLCREETVPWRRLLLAYDGSPAGGRALKLAGGLASGLNVDLDVLVAEPERQRVSHALDYAKRALRAYHVEGEFVQHRGRIVEFLQGAALELQSSAVVVPDGHTRLWQRSATVNAAIKLPGCLTLVVP